MLHWHAGCAEHFCRCLCCLISCFCLHPCLASTPLPQFVLFACPCRSAAAGQLRALCAGHLAAMQAAAAAAADEADLPGGAPVITNPAPWQADLGPVVESMLAVANALPGAIDVCFFDPVCTALASMAQVGGAQFAVMSLSWRCMQVCFVTPYLPCTMVSEFSLHCAVPHFQHIRAAG